jgi:hypothetical protein
MTVRGLMGAAPRVIEATKLDPPIRRYEPTDFEWPATADDS